MDYFSKNNTEGYTDNQLKKMNESFSKIVSDQSFDLKEAKEKFLKEYDSKLAQCRYKIIDIRGEIDLGFETFETEKKAEEFLQDLTLLDELEAPKNNDLKFYAIKTINLD